MHPISFRRSLAALALALLPFTATQAATQLDPAFASNGRYIVTPPTGYTFFRTLAHLPRPDGTSVAVVFYRHSNPAFCPADRDCLGLYPFNAAGTMTGAITVPIALNFSIPGGATIDAQGRIVVVGAVQMSGQDYDFRVIRLLPNGNPDTNFSGDGMATIAFDAGGSNYDRANAVTVDEQGRIVVVGTVSVGTNDRDFGIARLTSTGALDVSFNTTGRKAVHFDLGSTNKNDEATAVALGAEGEIIVGGYGMLDGPLLGYARIALTRLLANGAYDTSFCPGSCNFMAGYTHIHSGRRVTYVGIDGTTDSDSLSALSLAPSGGILTAGVTNENGVASAYVQTFFANGNYQDERVSDGGVAGDDNSILIGGVHYADTSPTSDIVLTGTTGPTSVLFFAQRFSNDLVPVANWGFIGQSNSVYLWAGGNGFGDAEWNLPAQSSLDTQGRVLTGGSFKPTAALPYSATIARLTAGVAPSGPALFSDGFEP